MVNRLVACSENHKATLHNALQATIGLEVLDSFLQNTTITLIATIAVVVIRAITPRVISYGSAIVGSITYALGYLVRITTLIAIKNLNRH